MKFISVIILSVILLSGCGYDPSNPPYDTKINPEGFPDDALVLLDQIESNSLKTLEDITLGFADIYTENSDLLDNTKWHAVIDILGLRLNRKGDIALEMGVMGYTAASDYYSLAAFARPSDSSILIRHNLFSAWRQMKAFLPDRVSPLELDLEQKIRFARRFYTASKLSRQFFNGYLRDPLFGTETFSKDATSALSSTGQAFISVMGFSMENLPTSKASFGDEPVELVAITINPVDSIYQIVEIYFYSEKEISRDFSIGFRVFTTDSTFLTISDPIRFIPYDFEPIPASTEWPTGQVALVHRKLQYSEHIDEVAVGLIDNSKIPPVYLLDKESNSNFVRIKIM